MDYRTGKCSQCGAEYKVPASFAHSAARCKQCKGVVQLGPPQGGAPSGSAGGAAAAAASAAPMPAKKVVPKPAAPSAPRPAAAEAPKPAPAPEPAEKKGGTLERLRAERASTPAPTPAPAPKPAAPAAKAPAPAAKPAAPAPAAKPAPAAPVAARGAARKEKDEDESPSKRGGRRGAKERPETKKKSPAGLLAVVALVVVGAAAFLFKDKLFGGEEPAEAQDETVSAGSTPEAGGTTPQAPLTAEAQSSEAPEAAPASEREEAPAAAAPEKKADPKLKDPASIDLAAIADFGPTPDTSAEEWTKLQDGVVQMLDTDAGAAGTKARRMLIEQKRKSVPAILNVFKKLDFATEAGRKGGDLCQSALKDIWNGTNFDWRYPDEAAGKPVTDPNDVWFCKRSTELWCTLWKQAEENIEVWIQKAKLEEKDPEEAKRLRETFGKPTEAGADEEAGGGGDDLDVD